MYSNFQQEARNRQLGSLNGKLGTLNRKLGTFNLLFSCDLLVRFAESKFANCNQEDSK